MLFTRFGFVNLTAMSSQPSNRMRHAVIGIVVRDEKFLAIERSHTVVAPGKICFPGGGVHKGETEAETLVRELREELNIVVNPHRKLLQSISPWGYNLSWWQAHMAESQVIRANPQEVARFFWATADELLAMDLLDSNQDFLSKLANGEFQLT